MILFELGDYKYYHHCQLVFNSTCNGPIKNHRHLMQHAAEVYCISTGRCIKHRTFHAETINKIMQRAGHIE